MKINNGQDEALARIRVAAREVLPDTLLNEVFIRQCERLKTYIPEHPSERFAALLITVGDNGQLTSAPVHLLHLAPSAAIRKALMQAVGMATALGGEKICLAILIMESWALVQKIEDGRDRAVMMKESKTMSVKNHPDKTECIMVNAQSIDFRNALAIFGLERKDEKRPSIITGVTEQHIFPYSDQNDDLVDMDNLLSCFWRGYVEAPNLSASKPQSGKAG